MRLSDVLEASQGGVVVDWGCMGWKLEHDCNVYGLRLVGVDLVEPPRRPLGAKFFCIENGTSAVPDEYADVVNCSHVIEHMLDAGKLMNELMRITKPGGCIWIEAPSEMSAQQPGSSDSQNHSFLSFWDDPTHIRPWTPGSLYRLALSHRCFPFEIARGETGGIPVVRMHAVKPLDATPEPQWRYVTLQGVPPGVSNAWRHVWGKSAALPKANDNPSLLDRRQIMID